MGKLYVDRQIAWSREQDIDFINPALGIRMPLLRGLVFVDYPGWEDGTWTAMAERDWYNRGGCLRGLARGRKRAQPCAQLHPVARHARRERLRHGEHAGDSAIQHARRARAVYAPLPAVQIRLVSRARPSRRRAYGCVAGYEKRAAEVLPPLRRADYGCLSQLRLRLRDAS